MEGERKGKRKGRREKRKRKKCLVLHIIPIKAPRLEGKTLLFYTYIE